MAIIEVKNLDKFSINQMIENTIELLGTTLPFGANHIQVTN